jgi:hypothetical protein
MQHVHGGCWQCIQQVLLRIGRQGGVSSRQHGGHDLSLSKNLIYVQTNNGVAHDGIDCELALHLMAEQQDDAAVGAMTRPTTTSSSMQAQDSRMLRLATQLMGLKMC